MASGFSDYLSLAAYCAQQDCTREEIILIGNMMRGTVPQAPDIDSTLRQVDTLINIVKGNRKKEVDG